MTPRIWSKVSLTLSFLHFLLIGRYKRTPDSSGRVRDTFYLVSQAVHGKLHNRMIVKNFKKPGSRTDSPSIPPKKKPSTKRSENARAVAREVIATVQAGRKVRKGLIIKKHGYSDSIATIPTKVTNTKSYQEEINPIVNAMIAEREAIMKRLQVTRNKAKYRDLVDGMDKMTKNIELLSGRDTARIGGLVDEIFDKL